MLSPCRPVSDRARKASSPLGNRGDVTMRRFWRSGSFAPLRCSRPAIDWRCWCHHSALAHEMDAVIEKSDDRGRNSLNFPRFINGCYRLTPRPYPHSACSNNPITSPSVAGRSVMSEAPRAAKRLATCRNCSRSMLTSRNLVGRPSRAIRVSRLSIRAFDASALDVSNEAIASERATLPGGPRRGGRAPRSNACRAAK